MATNTTNAQLLINKLKTNKRSHKLLQFPQNLNSQGTANIIRFNINLPSGSKYIANGDYKKYIDPKTHKTISQTYRTDTSLNTIADRFSENYVRTTTQIDLYMPHAISTTYQADWGTEELGMLGAATDAGYGIASINSWDDAAKAWEVVKRSLKESGFMTAAKAIQAITPFNFESVRKSASSTITNPYNEVLFNGIQNRTFSFTFKIVPQNEFEQKSLKAIIEEFKFHQMSEFKYGGQSNYILFPSEFDIQFLNRSGENPWLFKIATCALTNFSVNYSPEGQWAVHETGAPFSTEITMEFTELATLTKESIKKGY